jgi:hypothetical protein
MGTLVLIHCRTPINPLDGDPRWGNPSFIQGSIFPTFLLRNKLIYVSTNGANVFCFLSSLPLLPPATTAVFGSYLSSLYSEITLSLHCIAGAGLPNHMMGEVSWDPNRRRPWVSILSGLLLFNLLTYSLYDLQTFFCSYISFGFKHRYLAWENFSIQVYQGFKLFAFPGGNCS